MNSKTVFLSWSGDQSKAIANQFLEFIPQILPNVKPWISSHDIQKGAQFSTVIAEALDENSFGLFFFDKSNLEAPWILYEAGAIHKGASTSRVAVVLIDIPYIENSHPLSVFNATKLDKEDIRKLIQTINNGEIDEGRITKSFNAFYSEILEGPFSEIINKYAEAKHGGTATKEKTPPTETEIQILDSIRQLTNLVNNFLGPKPAVIDKSKELDLTKPAVTFSPALKILFNTTPNREMFDQISNVFQTMNLRNRYFANDDWTYTYETNPPISVSAYNYIIKELNFDYVDKITYVGMF